MNLVRLETETETVLHKVFMPVTSSMVKLYIRDRVRDQDLENGLYESETENETLGSAILETRRESCLCLLQSPHMLVQTELLLMMSLFKHVPWVKWFETHAQILIFRALKAFFARF